MGYQTDKQGHWAALAEASGVLPAVTDLAGAAADILVAHYGYDLYLDDFFAVVTTLLACDQTAPVVSVEYRDPDGSSNAVELATITFVEADAAGVVRRGVDSNSIDVRDNPKKVPYSKSLALVHKTQCADSSSAAGAAKVWAHLAATATDEA